MVVIVLMGNVSPKVPKGKGKEGERESINVKLGRYAVLIEFLRALRAVEKQTGSGTKLRAFAEGVEARLGAMLELEEKAGALPPWYKGLICSLFLRLRTITTSLRRYVRRSRSCSSTNVVKVIMAASGPRVVRGPCHE
jgi:hypothetical protein